jgi:Mn2+/Fe2+ NRAMP family transporter
MGFGGAISVGVLVAAGALLHPQQIEFEQYEQIALLVSGPLGKIGYYVLAGGLVVACLGAALELCLDLSNVYAQTFGWNWSENERPQNATRFSSVYTLLIFLACIPIALGLDPLKLTMFSMALTAVVLPLVVLPFLVLMNDPHYVGKHTNGRIGNSVVFFVIVLASILAIVSIPLEILGGK